MDKEEINKKIKDGWLRVWFAIEALGVNKDVVSESLKNHVAKLSRVQDVVVYRTDFKDLTEVKSPFKNFDKAFSQVVELEFLVKNLYLLINVVIMYGPSAVEIFEPKEIKIKIDEMQNISNLIAGLLHQFASAGVGGIVITPK